MQPRREFRFFIPEEKALRVRDFVREYMGLDEYSVCKPDHSYAVHTVYLDSDDWKMYWRTIRGDQDRWKLRLRYYDDLPESPVFCEVKHQMTDVIVKYRGGIKREALPGLLAGQLPHSSQLASRSPSVAGAVERFVTLMLKINAKPRLHIALKREGYISDTGKERVTMDRSICVSEVSNDLLSMQIDDPLICSENTVILELRFTERFPNWYREMVRIFDLSEGSLWEHRQGTVSCAGLVFKEAEVISNIIL